MAEFTADFALQRVLQVTVFGPVTPSLAIETLHNTLRTIFLPVTILLANIALTQKFLSGLIN